MKIFSWLYTLSATAVLGLPACMHKLDDVKPDTRVQPSQITRNSLPLLVNGARLGLTQNNFYPYFSKHDIMGDDVETLGSTGFESNNIPVGESALTFMYRYPYQCIGNANLAINFASQHKDDESLRPVAGEAYLLRAYAYMLLTEHFGDVVIMKGGETPDQRPFRDPVSKVRELIAADLQTAAEWLPDFGGNPLQGSKQAAQLLLARLQLELGRYNEALSLANAVIGSGRFALQSNFKDIFFTKAPKSREAIFQIAETSSNNSLLYGLPAVYGPGGKDTAGTGNTWIDSSLVKTYEATDVRKALFYKKKGTSLTVEVYFLMKFPQELTPSYPICRLSEAYLIAAEAAARTGVVDLTRYNELRAARGATTRSNSDFTGPQAFLEEIEMERRREFIGEHMRWNDMRRFGKAIPYLTALQQPKGHVLMPIPERELFLNPNMTQNEDYTQ